MAITDSDIEQLRAAVDRGRDEWINGTLSWDNPGSLIRQADDATIFGPFGGVAPPGRAPIVMLDRQKAGAAMFKGGTGTTEFVRAIVEGDLAVLVLVDRSKVHFDGHEGAQPWALRITEVFRKESGSWVRVHRHADPLTRFRDLEETLALQQDGG
jgi:ketosteroid isomerase-like protein